MLLYRRAPCPDCELTADLQFTDCATVCDDKPLTIFGMPNYYCWSCRSKFYELHSGADIAVAVGEFMADSHADAVRLEFEEIDHGERVELVNLRVVAL